MARGRVSQVTIFEKQGGWTGDSAENGGAQTDRNAHALIGFAVTASLGDTTPPTRFDLQLQYDDAGGGGTYRTLTPTEGSSVDFIDTKKGVTSDTLFYLNSASTKDPWRLYLPPDWRIQVTPVGADGDAGTYCKVDALILEEFPGG